MQPVPPPQDYRFNERDQNASCARFWRCPVRLVEDGTWAGLWRGPTRLRGGGAAGALLPVLAMHAWPEQKEAAPGWTPWVRIPWRQLARLAGLDKDTIATALSELAIAGLVESLAEPLPEDVRSLAWHRISATAFAGPGESYVTVPGIFVYGGGWRMLPGTAARHLLIAWAAQAWTLRASPGGGRLPRSLRESRPGLGWASGLGRTSLSRASADLVAWTTPAGDRLIQDIGGFLRPDFTGVAARHRWDSERLETRNVAATVRWAEDAAHPWRGAGERAAADHFEARKRWWTERYLASWASRVLRRGTDPVQQAVFVDLAPGSAEGGLAPGLKAAAEIALRMRGQSRTRETPLRVVAVVRDADAAARLQRARAAYAPAVQVVAADPAVYLQEHASEFAGRALLVFLGEVESSLISWPMLHVAVGGRDREAVALTRRRGTGREAGRLWVRGGPRSRQANRRGVAWLAQTALSAGAASVLSTGLRSSNGDPAGMVVHAGGRGATLAWKSAVGAKPRAEREFTARAHQNLPMARKAAMLEFAGRDVLWSAPGGEGPTLREFYLRSTPLLPLDLLAVRRELTRHGLRVSHRPFLFGFPPRP